MKTRFSQKARSNLLALLEIQLISSFHFGDAVSAKFVDESGRDFKGNNVFDNDAGSGYSTDVASFIASPMGFFGIPPNGIERFT